MLRLLLALHLKRTSLLSMTAQWKVRTANSWLVHANESYVSIQIDARCGGRESFLFYLKVSVSVNVQVCTQLVTQLSCFTDQVAPSAFSKVHARGHVPPFHHQVSKPKRHSVTNYVWFAVPVLGARCQKRVSNLCMEKLFIVIYLPGKCSATHVFPHMGVVGSVFAIHAWPWPRHQKFSTNSSFCNTTMHASAFVVSANMEHAPNPWTAFRNLWNTFFAHHPKSSLSWMTNSMAITAVVHTFLTNLYPFFWGVALSFTL